MDYPFRAKADALGSLLVDLKSTQDINKFKYSARAYNYDSQCYIYCNLFGKSYKDFWYIVIDKTPTNEIALVDVSEEFYYSGEEKVERAIKQYEKYIKNDFNLNDYLVRETL